MNNMKLVTVAVYVGGSGSDTFTFKVKDSTPVEELHDHDGHPSGKLYDYLIENLVDEGNYDEEEINYADVTVLDFEDIDEIKL